MEEQQNITLFSLSGLNPELRSLDGFCGFIGSMKSLLFFQKDFQHLDFDLFLLFRKGTRCFTALGKSRRGGVVAHPPSLCKGPM